MNTDFIIWDEPIREKEYQKNITSKADSKNYSDSCKTIKKYAKEQNTIYNPLTNQILYGINSLMKVSGVSDGTCNQINPYIYQSENICGAGAAGGNRCVTDALTRKYKINSSLYLNNNNNNNNNSYNNNNYNNNTYKKTLSLENFNSKNDKYYCDNCNITQFIITILLIILLIGVIYTKYSNEKI